MSLIGALAKAVKAGEATKKTAPFYSSVDEALSNIARPKGTGAEFYTELTKQPGVKKAELADRKLEQAFKAKGKITKEEAQQVLKDNPPAPIKEKVYDESTAIDEADLREMVAQEMFGKPYSKVTNGSYRRLITDEVYKRMSMDSGTQYGKWKTPDGENYREILLKLPEAFNVKEMNRMLKLEADLRRGDLPTNEMEELTALQNKKRTSPKPYIHGHWKDDTNVLAHMRVQDRTGPNGEKILHVEEIQSDWHQAGRKGGYRNEAAYQEARQKADEVARAAGFNDALHAAEGWKGHGMANAKEASDLYDEASKFKSATSVPDAPFKKNWHELAMKRLLNYAADNGYDSIAITPGAEQAKRYGLSSVANEVSYHPDDKGRGMFLNVFGKDNKVIYSKLTPESELPSVIGKEASERLLSQAPDDGNRVLRGLDLEVGGEGMKGFYDKMLPDYLNNFGKPYGAQIKMSDTPVSTRDPMDTSWGGGMPGDHPFITSQDLTEPFDGMVDLLRRNEATGEHTLVGRMLRADSERRIASELQKLDTYNQIKLHNFPITPEMRESIKQKGLPLYQQVGIPTAGAASQALQPEEEAGLAGGGSVAKLAALAKLKKLKEEMAPRAEAVQNLMKMDENRYLRDVVPNSLTNESIESEIARMKARAEAVQPEVKEAKGGKVRMTTNRDAMFMELSNKKLKRK